MGRIYNFSAGPSMLPLEVLEKAASEMTDYNGSGMSVMEMSHRSSFYEAIIAEAEADLRKLMNIPDNYKVLFLQGGASTQFSAVPLNLMNGSGKADYIVSGMFSKKAYAEAQKFGDVKLVATSADKNFTYIPDITPDMIRPDADYVHICYNNTIYGTKYPEVPNVGDHVLVADMSSCILSEPVDVTKFGLIYAGAQKNMGPAGLTVVIIREDLLGYSMDFTPTMFKYDIHAENGSMYNTPPTFAIYVCKLMLEWVDRMGGLEAMAKRNYEKADALYGYLDNSKLFKPTVLGEDRSIMNVPFVTGNADLDAAFVKQATAQGLVNLKGHRSVGGMRASIYNAMDINGVNALIEFMAKFEKENR